VTTHFIPGGAFCAAAEPADLHQPGPNLSMKGESMKIKERLTQKIYPDKWGALDELDKKYNEFEKPAGFPPKTRYQLIISNKGSNTLVVEREWESFAAMEAAYEKLMANPEWFALNAESSAVIKDGYSEILMPLP
jgi:hypothetical protein